jgi:hypothetical protein
MPWGRARPGSCRPKLYSHSAGSVRIRRRSPVAPIRGGDVDVDVDVVGAIGDGTGEVCGRCRCGRCDDDDDDDDDDDEEEEVEEGGHSLIISACQSSNRMSGLNSTDLSRVERSARGDRGGASGAAAAARDLVAGGANAAAAPWMDASRNGSAARENRAMIGDVRTLSTMTRSG